MQAVWVNGIPTDQIKVTDRGFCYGDGIFETIAVVDGRPQLLSQHLNRMRSSLERLGFPEAIETVIESDLALLPFQGDQTLKLIVTRGNGFRGYMPPQEVSATRVMTLTDRVINYDRADQGVVTRLCDYRLPLNPALAQLKHLNRLDQIMARNEWHDPNIAEGIMLDAEGFLIEGTMSNLFWFNSAAGELQTPLIDRCGVKGVMRDHIISLSHREGVRVVEGRFSPSVLSEASEAFICNSLIGIWPIVALDHNHYKIGSITRKLQSILGRELD